MHCIERLNPHRRAPWRRNLHLDLQKFRKENGRTSYMWIVILSLFMPNEMPKLLEWHRLGWGGLDRAPDKDVSGWKPKFNFSVVWTLDRCIVHMWGSQVSCSSTLLTELIKKRKNFALLQHKPFQMNATNTRGLAVWWPEGGRHHVFNYVIHLSLHEHGIILGSENMHTTDHACYNVDEWRIAKHNCSRRICNLV